MHFTYIKPNPDEDLRQGDLLNRTVALMELIGKFHPYYAQDKYKAFFVLTQTCDLVRSRSTSVPYITLCPVRPLSIAMEIEARKHQKEDAYLLKANAVSNRGYNKLKDFLSGLLNNNREDYFYLNKEDDLGIVDSYCAFIRLSFSLKWEHYQTCLDARVSSLQSEFQAKLGSHVSRIFGRVATDDWVPAHCTNKEWEKKLVEVMASNVVAIDESQLKVAKEKLKFEDLADKTPVEVVKMIKSVKIPKRRIQFIERAISVLTEKNIVAADAISARKARAALESDTVLSSIIRD